MEESGQPNVHYPIGMDQATFRHDIQALQKHLDKVVAEDASQEFHPPVEHFFAPGLYSRVMTIPPGGIIVGKIHKHAHMNVISKGVIDVLTEFSVVRYVAPVTFVSEPMTKRCVQAVEEAVWTTIHATNETDIEKIEAEIIAPNYEVEI